jgi:phosphate transport system protein
MSELHVDDLKYALLRMGGRVEEMIASAVDAIASQSDETARRVIDRDRVVDEEELRIDELCLRLLSQGPVEADIRFITASLQMATDLERMADLAVDIAHRGAQLMARPMVAPLVRIDQMATIARRMLRNVLQALVGGDPELARSIRDDEHEADRLRDETERDIKQMVVADIGLVDVGVSLLVISRCLERICDHATNVAEDVMFVVEGRVARHSAWMRS